MSISHGMNAANPRADQLRDLVEEILEEMEGKETWSVTLHCKGEQVRVEYRHFSKSYTLDGSEGEPPSS